MEKTKETSELKQGYYFINNKHVFEPNICVGSKNYFDLGQDIIHKTLMFEGKKYEFAGSTLCINGFAFCLEYKLIENKKFIGNTPIARMIDETIHPEKYNKKQFVEFNEDLFKAYIAKFSKEDKLKAFKIHYDICLDSGLLSEIKEITENIHNSL